MEVYNTKGDRVDGDHQHKTEQQQLIKIMAISAVIDIASTTGTFATLGLGIVIEELIESAVSQMIAKFGNIKLSKLDNTIGLLPIPGVTAVTVHCARRLFAMNFKNKFA